MIDPIKPENDKSVTENDNNVTEHELLISKLKEEVQVKFYIEKQKRLIIGNKFYEILIFMNDNKATINSFLFIESGQRTRLLSKEVGKRRKKTDGVAGDVRCPAEGRR